MSKRFAPLGLLLSSGILLLALLGAGMGAGAAFAKDPEPPASGSANTGTEVPFEPLPSTEGGEGAAGEEGTESGENGESGEAGTTPAVNPSGDDTETGAQPSPSSPADPANPANPDTTADPSGTDPATTPGADPAADPAASPDPAPEPPAKPYSTLTPVGGADNPDNRVNTHQLPDSSFLYDTSLADLADANPYHDGQTVQIIGEVIGDILHDGTSSTHVWVTLASTDANSDATVVVYLPAASAAIIDTLGAYGKTGTILQVRGTFYLACPDHEGVSDLHVENVNVVSPGSTTPDVFAWEDFVPGIVLLALAAALLLVFHLLRQRLR